MPETLERPDCATDLSTMDLQSAADIASIATLLDELPLAAAQGARLALIQRVCEEHTATLEASRRAEAVTSRVPMLSLTGLVAMPKIISGDVFAHLGIQRRLANRQLLRNPTMPAICYLVERNNTVY